MKNKFVKIFLLILALAVMTVSFYGCNSEKGTDEKKDNETESPAVTDTPEPTATPTATPTEEPTPEPTPEPTAIPETKPEISDVTPVIIIPGIMGSELVQTNNNLSVIWPFLDMSADMSEMTEQEKMLMLMSAATKVAGLTLKEDLSSPMAISGKKCEPVTSALENGTNIGTGDTYRALAAALSEKFGSENVYFYGYDFRYDSVTIAKDLKEFIDGILSKRTVNKVNIVAHSMGGLVLSSYLESEGGEKVNKAVVCGTPFYGSELTTTVLKDASSIIDLYLSSEIKESLKVFNISDVITSCAASFPSVYQMVPEKSFERENYTGNAAQKGKETADYLKANLADAFAEVEFYNVVGDGLSTYAADETTGTPSLVNGDGTVTYESATAGKQFEDKTKVFTGTDHGKLVTEEECLNYITEVLAK